MNFVIHRLPVRTSSSTKDCSGFTLVELLVVISVISLLSSFLLVSFKDVRYRTDEVTSVSDLRTVTTAMELYYQTNKDWPPVGLSVVSNSVTSCTTDPKCIEWSQLGDLLRPYLSKLQIPRNNSIMYMYVKNANGEKSKITFTENGLNRCLILRNGYYLNLMLPKKSGLTTGDGGIYSYGVESVGGDYNMYYNNSDCAVAQ